MIGCRLVILPLTQRQVDAFDIGLQIKDGLEGFFCFLQHSQPVFVDHVLGQVTDGHLLGQGNNAPCRGLQTGQQFEQGRLASPVLAHQGNAVFLIDHKGNGIKQGKTSELDRQAVNGNHGLRVSNCPQR